MTDHYFRPILILFVVLTIAGCAPNPSTRNIHTVVPTGVPATPTHFFPTNTPDSLHVPAERPVHFYLADNRPRRLDMLID
jgi:hypothetical protein